MPSRASRHQRCACTRSRRTSPKSCTLPRSRPNSRLKDLPDLALLAGVRLLEAERVRAALEQTFGFRKTHDLPTTVPAPPASWAAPYAALAAEDQLEMEYTGGRAGGGACLSRSRSRRWCSQHGLDSRTRAMATPMIHGLCRRGDNRRAARADNVGEFWCSTPGGRNMSKDRT